MMYEAFWTLTANMEVTRSGLVGEVDGQRDASVLHSQRHQSRGKDEISYNGLPDTTSLKA